ncbi:MAG TPA: hypothetical protein DEQ02_07320 [Ruminococcaceae bacterium]|nr:hypothetical protein [Oscillospiraceae bacterium]
MDTNFPMNNNYASRLYNQGVTNISRGTASAGANCSGTNCGGTVAGGNYPAVINTPQSLLPQDMGSFPAASSAAANRQEPETMTNNVYTPAFLRNFIGRLCRVEFLIGNAINDRVGRLLDVGASYIVLQALEPSTIIVCDIYSIKFVTIVQDSSSEPLLMV